MVFFILFVSGLIAIISASEGSRTFNEINSRLFKTFEKSEHAKQDALEVVALFYLMGSDHSMDLLMSQIPQYDKKTEDFTKSLNELKTLLQNEKTETNQKNLELIDYVQNKFEVINNNCRAMTFAMMENKKEESIQKFSLAQENIQDFIDHLTTLSNQIRDELLKDSASAKNFLDIAKWINSIISFGSLIIALLLISYLMKFLSQSLLPISNFIHNMRQSVFSINSDLKVIAPVSNYSLEVFDLNIVNQNISDILFTEFGKNSENESKISLFMP